jgi:drug/metabolite transporter (DMT)-like permease
MMPPRASVENPHRGYLFIILAALSFGIYPAAAQLTYATGTNAVSLIVVSTALRALSLVIAALLNGYSLRDVYRDSLQAIGSGFLQALSIFGIIVSLQYIPGPVMITIVFSHTLMLLVLLAVRGEQKLTSLTVGTSVAALLGISLVVDLFGSIEHIAWRGVGLALLAAIASASRMYAFGNQVKTTAPEIVGARAFTFATVFLLLLLIWEPPQSPSSSTGMLWFTLACLSLIAGTLFAFMALGRLGSFRTSLMGKVEPVFTCAYSWFLLGEVLHASQYLGIVLVLASLAFYQIIDKFKLEL